MPDFTGQFGGLIAGAAITGFGLGWTWAVKILVKPLEKRLDSVEADMKAINSTLRNRWLNGSDTHSE